MKKILFAFWSILLSVSAFAQNDSLSQEAMQKKLDSLAATFKYETGTIALKDDVAKLEVPKGFKYLDVAQSEKVLYDLWGNPRNLDQTLGMLFPEDGTPLSRDSWAFNITYDEIGYVKDDDAEGIDYDDLLKDMQAEAEAGNEERKKQGFETMHLVNWAAKPFYDKDKKVLHWAQELKFGASNEHTLNYNVRVLGRKGILILNAIGSMDHLNKVNQNLDYVISAVKFNEGLRYENFDSGVDKVAAYTIGGLVAGKVLAKVGFFALLLKFWKLIALAFVGIGAFIWRLFRNGSTKEESTNPETPTTPTEESPSV